MYKTTLLNHCWEDWNKTPCWVVFDRSATRPRYVETTCILPGDPPNGWINWSDRNVFTSAAKAAEYNALIRDKLNLDLIQFILTYDE